MASHAALPLIASLVLLYTRGILTASFYGDSSISLPYDDSFNDLQLDLRFLTTQSYGLLLSVHGQSDFLQLQLISGFLELSANFGSGHWSLSSDQNVDLNDQSWHYVEVKQKGRNVTLQVDGVSWSIQIPGPLIKLNKKAIFIGGPNAANLSTSMRTYKHFRGCITNIILNGYDIYNHIHQIFSANFLHHISWTCSPEFLAESKESIYMKSDQSYIAFPYLPIASTGTLAFDFKTYSPTTFLALNVGGNTSNSDLLALEIINGRIKMTLNRGGTDMVIISRIVVNDNSWHSVLLTCELHRAILQVDNERQQAAFDRNSRKAFQFSSNFLMGGLTYNIKNQITNSSALYTSHQGSNFRGCFRNIMADSKLIGFKEMVLSNAIEVGCPWTERIVTPKPRDSQLDTSTKATQIVRVIPLKVNEGHQTSITDSNIQVVFDYHHYGIRESAIQFKITQPPEHGTIQIERRTSNDAFTLLDLIGRKVSYLHDGSETTNDNIAIEMIVVTSSDDVPSRLTQTYAFVLSIIVAPIDDAPHILLLNATSERVDLEIATDSKMKIDIGIINVQDADTDPSLSIITSKCSSGGSHVGYFERMDNQGHPVNMFSHQEILEGLIWFKVSDAETTCILNISSTSVTVRFVPVSLRITLTKITGLRLAQGSFSLILPGNLTVTSNVAHQNLVIKYVVTQNPRYGEIQRKMNSLWSSASVFTQEDIMNEKVRYVQNKQTDTTPTDSFKFTVHCLRDFLSEAPFFIQIERLSVDVRVARSIALSKKDYYALSRNDLLAETNDKMMSAKKIRFVLLRAPAHGNIYRVHKKDANPDILSDMQPLRNDEYFTQEDIFSGFVVYKLKQVTHRRVDDFVDLKIEAGIAQPKLIRIHLDYTPPVSNVRFTNNGLKTVNEGGFGTIERTNLYLETKEYAEFEFDVIDFPEHGVLQRMDPRSGIVIERNVSRFLNEDIRNIRLVYYHDNSENNQDRFTFVASPILGTADSLPIKVQEFRGTFQIKILMRNDNSPQPLVNEVFNVVINKERVITLDNLAFTDPDIDYDPMNLVYRFESISNGALIYTDNNTVVSEFTQRDIANGKISFRHRGADFGKVMCLVNDGQFYTQFVFEIKADKPYVKISNNTGIIVKDNESVAITTFNLSVVTNENVDAKSVRFYLIEEPLYGNLEVMNKKVTEFSLQILMDGLLFYRHKGRSGTQDTFKFAVVALQAQEQDTFIIQIFQSSQNSPPRVVHNSILEVPELGEAVFMKNNLQVTHPDYLPSNIIFTIKDPPKHGRLQLQSQHQRQQNRDFSFTQDDIDKGLLKYHHSDFSPTADFFMFDVTNGIQTLRGLQFAIEIIPSRLELEIQNFTIQEGSRKALTKNNIRLKSRYYDGKTIRFTVVKLPKHGWLEEASRRGRHISTFTFSELSQGRIYFIHDNSESVEDSITVRGRVEEDKKDTREAVLYISVQTVNDQPPVVVINKGLILWRSSIALITKEILKSEDRDSPPRDIIYRIYPPGSSNGRVALLNNTFHAIEYFTQKQINEGQVVFVHAGADHGGFIFYITDGTNSNRKRETFRVTAQPLTLTLMKNKPLKVYPSKGQTITADNLLAKTNDPNQTKPIIYHIQQKPQKGKIVTMYKDRPLEVMSFKQDDINEGKIMYQHEFYTMEWSDTDSLQFEVRTLYAESIINQKFDIDISYGNFLGHSQNDVVYIQGFVVKEGGEHVITNQNIDISNYTQQLESTGKRVKVWYTLQDKCRNGNLIKGGRTLGLGDRFLQSEINGNQLVYRHDNSDSTNDSFSFNVHLEILEGSKNTLQEMKLTFNISVLPVNDQPFRIIIDQPLIEVVEGMNTVVTNDVIKTVDIDTPPGGIVYHIKSMPTNGILGLRSFPMRQIRSFTQKDIDEGKIIFTHRGSKRKVSFKIDVSDGKFPPLSTVVTVSIVPITLQVTSNRTIFILQADTSEYITKDNLDISTNGNRQKVHYEITSPPALGQIFKLVHPVTYFKQVDIDSRNILYIQRNLSSHTDSFYCDMYYEGSNTRLRRRKVVVMVKPLVKQHPLAVIPGDHTPITTSNLDASQLANITGLNPTYTLVEKPKYGHLVKSVRRRREGNGRSQYREIDEFTHEDVLYVKIYYIPRDLPYQRYIEDSFSYLLHARGVQPAMGKMTLNISPKSGVTTTVGKYPPNKPKLEGNSTHYSNEPNQGEIVSPSVSPDFVIILAILIPLFVLVILVIIVVFLLWRRQRYRNYAPPGTRGMQQKSRFRPNISGPVSLDQPHVHIQLQEGLSAPEDNQSLVYEHHNYCNVPVTSKERHYVNSDLGQSDADDLDTPSEDQSNAATPLVDANLTEISATVPECKVTPLLGAECGSPERSSRCSLDLFDWSMIEDPEFLQHCRTTTPVLRDSQYWV